MSLKGIRRKSLRDKHWETDESIDSSSIPQTMADEEEISKRSEIKKNKKVKKDE